MKKCLEIDPAELKSLYSEQGLSQREIAEKRGVARRTIGKLMHKMGIPIREHQRIKVDHPCDFCGQSTTNPRFCSTSCAAKYNNHHFPKRKTQKREWVCVECGNPTSERRKYCDDCVPNQYDWMDRSIGGLSRDEYNQMYRVVRSLARRIYSESGRPLRCVVCDYGDYVEICHIRAISTFDKRVLIREVNQLENLVALCPNHHWEFDNGRMTLETLKQKAR